MDRFDWMTQAIGASQPSDLQSQGVRVYQAPQVPPDRKVVNLVNGVIVNFSVEHEIPATGFYADLEDITSLANQSGRGLVEQSGAMRPIGRSSDLEEAMPTPNGKAATIE